MSEFDLLITGGEVINAADSFQSDIAIRDGKIVAIGANIGTAKKTIDASGQLVMPGGIEAHCHIEQESSGGIMTSDDYYSGSVSAAYGGNTCFVPFAAQHRGQSIKDVLQTYQGRAEPKSVIDYSFHLIVSDPTDKVLYEELPAAFERGITSFKIFMTYDRLLVDDEQILDILAVAKQHGALTMVHAENNSMIKWMSKRLLEKGYDAPEFHAASHPRAAESEAINRVVELATFIDTPLLVVHVSTEAGVSRIAEARHKGHKIFGETCPQYLFLEARNMDLPDMAGAKYCCSPPLRDKITQEQLWRALQNGTLQMYSSDHSPYKFDETGKLVAGPNPSFTEIASGLPGIELRLPLLFSEGVNKGRITLNQFVALAATNAAKIYGMDDRKGSITLGKDADIAIWDPGLKKVVTHSDLHDNMDYTPYEGMELTGWPTRVIRRGEVIVEQNDLRAERGSGRFLKRKPVDTRGMPGVLAPELDPMRNFGAKLL